MIKIGKNCNLKNTRFEGNADIIIGDNVKFGREVIIDVTDKLVIGDRTQIGDYSLITGRDIEIGKEFWMGRFAKIGGGGAKTKYSMLRMGDQCHLGDFGSINTARTVVIGNEVGMGEGTKIYTHGSYLSVLEGYPVNFNQISIGSNVWIPNAIVLAEIGDNVVISAMSLVNRIIPSGCLAGGIPVKILRENCYPKHFTATQVENMVEDLVKQFVNIENIDTLKPKKFMLDGSNKRRMYVDDCMTLFDFGDKRIDGRATEFTDKWKDFLRRNGVRFKYFNDNGVYRSW